MDPQRIPPAEPTLRPFVPADFDEACEDCEAPAGTYCRPHCPSGYTADEARRDAVLAAARRQAS
ncbi:MAG: hypothetical protein HOV68_30575 [Streptomycetaceae bacterium]|nr:hypothetical protein [Streptomycetaceae bacterium]